MKVVFTNIARYQIGSTLLDTKIQVSIVYQRQQDTLIVWSDTDKRDMALSFQEKVGCDEIWEKICEVLGEDPSAMLTHAGDQAQQGSSVGGQSNGTGTGGSGAGAGEGQEESDEDQLEGEMNASPSMDLPLCEIGKLKEIRDFFVDDMAKKSKKYKENLATVLETDSYIRKLLELFHMCEDLENLESLSYLFEIFRSLFYLNKSSLLDILLSDELILDVIGCLEYDPNKPEPTRHREFIQNKSNFREIISFDNGDLINKIHQTYKVQYIQDVILPAPSMFEENSLTALASYIFLNKVEISNLIQVCAPLNLSFNILTFVSFKADERFLAELFENLKNINLEVERRRDMLQFLHEFISFLYGLQQTREPFIQLLHEHGLLDVIEMGLMVKDDKSNQLAIDILSPIVEISPTIVREYILSEIESKSSVSNLNMSLSNSRSNTPTSHLTANNSNSCSTANGGTSSGGNQRSSPFGGDTKTENTSESTAKSLPPPSSTTVSSNSRLLTMEELLNIDELFEPILINYIIKQMINDPDQELGGAMQIINTLKLLIDPQNMLSVPNVCLSFFFIS